MNLVGGVFFILGKYYIVIMVLIIVFIVFIIMVMNIYFCGAEVRLVLYWVKVVILKYMFRILFVYDVGESCFSFRYS